MWACVNAWSVIGFRSPAKRSEALLESTLARDSRKVRPTVVGPAGSPEPAGRSRSQGTDRPAWAQGGEDLREHLMPPKTPRPKALPQSPSRGLFLFLGTVFEPVAFACDLDDFGVVEEAVEDGGGGRDVA